MEEERIIGLIVDHYDGTLSHEQEGLLARLVDNDASVRAMYDDYGASMGLSVPPPEAADTEALRRGVMMAVAAAKGRTRRRRVMSVVAAAAAVATIFAVLTYDTGSRTEIVPVMAVNVGDRLTGDISPEGTPANDTEQPHAEPMKVYHQPKVSERKREVTPATRRHDNQVVTAEEREEFFLAAPLDMIALEHDPADMLGALSSLPEIYAGYSRYAPGKGFQVRITEIVRNIKTIAL
ncbi:MAG: hypothetical protein K2N86_03815 [Rikenellaceae bacterium]|nr:hypothetical protein [Rikenellaceae bacterium]MDE7356029.1 hypothetical protein [Rikenellaceae bacterium]